MYFYGACNLTLKSMCNLNVICSNRHTIQKKKRQAFASVTTSLLPTQCASQSLLLKAGSWLMAALILCKKDFRGLIFNEIPLRRRWYDVSRCISCLFFKIEGKKRRLRSKSNLISFTLSPCVMITQQHIYETEGGLFLLPHWHGEADGSKTHMSDETLLVKGFEAEKHVC